MLELLYIKRGKVVSESQAGSGDLQIVSADHHSARFLIGPGLGVAPGLNQIERLHKNRSQDLIDMPLAPDFASGVACALDAMKEF
jgi:hypothetical protein